MIVSDSCGKQQQLTRTGWVKNSSLTLWGRGLHVNSRTKPISPLNESWVLGTYMSKKCTGRLGQGQIKIVPDPDQEILTQLIGLNKGILEWTPIHWIFFNKRFYHSPSLPSVFFCRIVFPQLLHLIYCYLTCFLYAVNWTSLINPVWWQLE